MSDRTVHAEYEFKEIVRYDRAGKWFLESSASALIPARRLSVREAARLAADSRYYSSGRIYFGRPGGASFDRLTRDLLAHEHALR